MSITIVLPYHEAEKGVHNWAIEEETIDFRRERERATRCTVSFAATELDKYFTKLGFEVAYASAPVTGSQNVVLSFDDIHYDGCEFTLSPLENGVSVHGTGRVGVLYGCYELLRLQGVRWLAPGDDIVPEPGAPLVLPTETKDYVPSMPAGRGFYIEGPLKESTNLWLWMARNRLNLSTFRPNTHKFQKKLGLIFVNGGHFFNSILNPNNHTEDGRTFWEAHRDWYSAETKEKALDTQFCTSNEELLEFLSNAVVERLCNEWYYVDRLDVWGFDAWGGFCRCEKCCEIGNASDGMLNFLSYLRAYTDKAIAEGRLDHNVIYNIESYEGTCTMDPPLNDVPENIKKSGDCVEVFPIIRCYTHQFYDDACYKNGMYHKAFDGWHNIPLIMGEYYNVSKFEDLPVLFTRIMPNDFRYWHAHNTQGITYLHLPFVDWGVRNITQLMYAQLAWDINTDIDAFLDQYFTDRYSDNAAEVRRAYELLEDAFYDIQSWRAWGDDSILSKLQNWNGTKPQAPIEGNPCVKGDIEARGEEILSLLREALAIFKRVHREEVSVFCGKATVRAGVAINPNDKRFTMSSQYVERLEEDLRLTTYALASMELLVWFLQYHNAWYRGEDKESIWEKIQAACDDAVCRYTTVVYPNERDVEVTERDILERAQLKSTYYAMLKNRK